MSVSTTPEDCLKAVFAAALEAVDPLIVVPPFLPERPKSGRTVVVGAGKAAARMAMAVESCWNGELQGIVVTRYGHGADCRRIEVVEAGHPVPDETGADAARRILDLVSGLGADDLVVCLISGGGSSLLSVPAPGVTLEEKRAINRALLSSGAPISEMNCVRRHLSAIKGGRLANACGPAQIVTLVISDVPGDDPGVVASGPTIADGSVSGEALAILDRYGIAVPEHIRALLLGQSTQKVAIPNPKNRTSVVATAQTALEAAARKASELGVKPFILSNSMEGEARDVGTVHASIARQIIDFGQPVQGPALLLSGGETTVNVRGNGRGGRNVEFLLALAASLDGREGIYALACDTDGIDGSEDNAGAILRPDTLSRAKVLGMTTAEYLANNNAYRYFERLDDLIFTGATRTNVNDFRAILIGV
ncbi:glycerate kinase [Agrobacterium tumefaciens]|uniref:glycerate kinase type-2 family protein n=1 Tax=Agrobacterium tumefaciens TaxID=358 RepID=UPI001574BB83|nr:glycerate kinase [Agrobacterium tumefaciens]MCZ7497327.1 glycerate kinase [Rhizobium rhizogenes]NTE56541.1 glycerate kinase [Agrobacterium tumefaciens]NTE74509.1 glycerate kinase [Agrobacterium tumefaciens]